MHAIYNGDSSDARVMKTQFNHVMSVAFLDGMATNTRD
jgi:hypothetical protein